MAQNTTDGALPYLHGALKRELAGIGAALLLLAAAIALGLGISQVLGWQYAGWRERLPFAGALGIGAFGSLGLLLAQFGLYRPFVLQAIAALVVLATLFVLAPGALRQVRSGGHLRRHLAVPRMPRNTTLLWIACAGLALFCAGVAALAPETQYDALWYHLTYPQRYLQAGYLVDIPADFVSLYPMTTELWYGYGLALGDATAAILLHLGYLLLTSILTYEFDAALHARRRTLAGGGAAGHHAHRDLAGLDGQHRPGDHAVCGARRVRPPALCRHKPAPVAAAGRTQPWFRPLHQAPGAVCPGPVLSRLAPGAP